MLPRELESPPSKRVASTQAASNARLLHCQVDGCAKPLKDTPGRYYKKFRICATCANMPALLIDDQVVRFCQQCGRFHPLTEFSDERRSCRNSLALHNARRRKSRLRISARAGQRTSAAAAAAAAEDAPPLAACEAALSSPLEMPPVTRKVEPRAPDATWPAVSAAAAAAGSAEAAAAAGGGSDGPRGEELLAPLPSVVDGQAELLPDMATWDMLSEPLDASFLQDAFGCMDSDTSPCGLGVGDAAFQLDTPVELPVQHMADPVPCDWEQPDGAEKIEDRQQQQQQQQHGQQVYSLQHQHGLQLQEEVLELKRQQQQFQQQQEQDLRNQLQLGQPPAQPPRPSPFEDMCAGSVDVGAGEWQLFCSTPLQSGHEHPSPARGIVSQGALAASVTEPARGHACLPEAAQALDDGDWDMACADPGWVPVAPVPLEAGAPSPTQQPALNSWIAVAGQSMPRAAPEGPAPAGAFAALPVLVRSTSLCSNMEVELSCVPTLPGSETPMQQLRSTPLPGPWSPPMADMERLSQCLFRKPFSDLAPHLQEDVLPCMAVDKAFVQDLVSRSGNRRT